MIRPILIITSMVTLWGLTTGWFAGQGVNVALPAGQGVGEILEQVLKISLLPSRPPEEIQADLARSTEELQRTDRDVATARATQEQFSKLGLHVKEEIEHLKSRIEAAKQAKQDTEKSTLEAQKKKAESLQKYIEHCQELFTAEQEAAFSAREHALAWQASCQAEQEAAARLAEREQGTTDPLRAGLAAATSVDKALQALKQLAESNKEAAGRAKKVADKRVDLQADKQKLNVALK